jgi:DNA replication factor GINS
LQYLILYEAWKKEKDSSRLQPLQKAFYAEAYALIRTQKDEVQMIDEGSLHAKLIAKQQIRTRRLLTELIEIRFQKVYNTVLRGETPSMDILTSEEEYIYHGLVSIKDQHDILSKAVLSGRTPHISRTPITETSRSLMVRFLQDIPSLVGTNGRLYGPFKTEDIATLPFENAESLIKRGVALMVEVE